MWPHARWLLLLLMLGTVGCNGAESVLPVSAGNPLPTITALSPSSVTAGEPAFTLTLTGAGFVQGLSLVRPISVVRWNGQDRATTFVSQTELQATIPASDLSAPGTAQVTVFNPSPGGGPSNAVTFNILPRSGVIVRLSVGNDGQAAGCPSDPADPFTSPTECNFEPSVGADGRFVAFASDATNVFPGDTNNARDVFLRDACVGAPTDCIPSTIRVSVASDGTQANCPPFVITDLSTICFRHPSMSADGRFVAFDSPASNLVVGDLNFNRDVFLRDTCIGAPPGCMPSTFLVSLATDGAQGNSFSQSPSISADGRFVAFSSAATTLVSGDTNFVSDVFVRDTCIGAPPGCTASTILASVASDGSRPGVATLPAISANGRFVAFSGPPQMVPGVGGGVYVRDTCLGAPAGCSPATVAAVVGSDNTPANVGGETPSISADGRFVAFSSEATNLVPGDTNQARDVFVRDTCLGAPTGCVPATIRVSVANDGSQGNAGSEVAIFRQGSDIELTRFLSHTGRFVAFTSDASNLVAGDTNGDPDIFVRDTCTGAAATGCVPSTVRVSVALDGTEAECIRVGTGTHILELCVSVNAISADGRFVVLHAYVGFGLDVPVASGGQLYLARTGF